MEIEFLPLERLGANASGSTYSFRGRPTSHYLLGFRQKGSLSGNHYHTGTQEAKNPEHFILVQGLAHFSWRSTSEESWNHRTVEGPILVRIYPQVVHLVEALSDLVFLELNGIDAHRADTHNL